MSDPRDKSRPDRSGEGPSPGAQRALGLLFGVAFGFLLQKGGVAKFHLLIGALLLEDFTVVRVMLSAIVVGMLGVLTLHRFGRVQLHVKPTRIAANAVGGVVFGVGFALAAYCPGTGAAALGQGNFDALTVMVGMMAGSFVYAEASGRLEDTIGRVGHHGKKTLPELVGAPRLPFAVLFAAALVAVIVWLELRDL